jgi:zinc transport system substrate-binding protein
MRIPYLLMRIRIILISAAAVLAAAGCGGGSEGSERTSVVASFYPLAFAAEEVGGASVDVRNLTPPGAEPHDLEASPGDVQELHDADLVLLLGDGFQPQLEDAAGEGDHVLYLLDTPGLDRLEDGDVHVWLDPLRYGVLVKRIGDALDRPDDAERLERRLQALDRAYQKGLAECARREIVTNHAAFGYLADRYALQQIPITGSSPEGEPAPRDLERAVEAVRETGATTVFVEPLVSERTVEAVAREAGAKTAVLNPVEGLTESGQDGADYFSLMRENLATLRKALDCR